jgi:Caspase domain
MRRLCLLAVLLFVPLSARAAGADGDLYLLGVALNQAGIPGGWAGVGEGGAWKGTQAGAVLKGKLYSTEANGALYVTDLASGKWQQVGKAEFGDTKWMFPGADKLYTIESSGNLYRVDPATGGWEQVGDAGAWKNTQVGTIFKAKLYTTETGGALYATDLGTGKWQQVGKAEFGKAAFLFAVGDKLYTLQTDGSLYRVDPGDGSRARVGAEGAWKGTKAGAVFDGRLYSAEADGTLTETDLATGKRQQLGKAEFGNTKFMFAGKDEVYTIETDGTLYRVFVKPKDSIDGFNWCPEEVEKVFRDQGAAYYHTLNARQVLGKKATHAGVLEGLAWLREKATKNDFVVMYVGAHGFTDPNEGWGVETADEKILWGRELKSELKKLPCPVLLFIETCTSGGFARAHKNDPEVPANVTVLCACTAKQSVDNQLDLALAEALYGRADFNKDGVVELDELIRYVERRYQEWWPDGKKTEDSLDAVIVKSKSVPGTLPLTKASADLAVVVAADTFASALLEKKDGDKYRVHLLGWSSRPGEPYFRTNAVPRDCICLPGDGTPLLVEQNGTWYPARLLKKEGDKYKVHYLGYNEEETVTKERVKYPFVGQEEKRPGK